jgi:dihydrofolate synthase/folylpolyglutamate synthase
VGLGGRLDATNVLTPEVAVITSLSLEHTYLLGDTLVEIAREKAGIIKPGVPAVSAPQRPEAAAEIAAICEAQKAPLTVVGRDWRYEAGPADLDGQMMAIRSAADGGSPLDGEYRLALLGRHQLENAACAVGALDVLRGQGYDVTAAAVAEGLGSVRWPGRFEVLGREPLVIADGAHNPYSMDTLCQALEAWFPQRRWVVVFGASADKDVAGMMERLLPISDYVIVTRSDHPRGAAPVELADVVASAGGGAEVSVSVKKAVLRGLDCLTPETGLLVTGSLHVVADAREVWAEYTDRPVPANDNDEVLVRE